MCKKSSGRKYVEMCKKSSGWKYVEMCKKSVKGICMILLDD